MNLVLSSVILFVSAFGATWIAAAGGMVHIDFFVLIERSYRVFLGQVPYRDFTSLTPPLTYLIQAGLFKAFGLSALPALFYICAQNALLCVMAWVFCVKVLGSEESRFWWIAPVILAWSPGLHFPLPWYDIDTFFFSFLELFCLSFAWRDPKSGFYPAAAGLFCALSVLSKQNVGAAALAFAFPFFVLNGNPLKVKIRQAALFLAGGSAVAAAFSAYLVHHGAFRDAFEMLCLRAYQGQTGARGGFADRLLVIVFDPGRVNIKIFLAAYLGAVFCAFWTNPGGSWGARFFRWSLPFCVAVYLFFHFLAACISQLGGNFAYQQAYLGIALGILFRFFDGWRRPWSWAPAGAALVLLALFVHVQKIVPRWKASPERMSHPAFRGLRAPAALEREVQILSRIDGIIPREDRVFSMPGTAFHFISARPMPYFISVFDEGLEVSPSDFARVKEELAKNEIRWVICMGYWEGTPRPFYADFVGYLKENYQPVDLPEDLRLTPAETGHYRLLKRRPS